ncbi:PQC542.21 [Streptomyces azureus]|uniref:PQC542.21 n=1 Tax=Streptomyces azureus TaxID=146537 RepID=A0A0K8PWR3_STRAJ|nr:PQC542.21 [Streptomyces azureus]
MASALGISQRTVERYVKDQIRQPRADLAQRLEKAVHERWQPRMTTACGAGLTGCQCLLSPWADLVIWLREGGLE